MANSSSSLRADRKAPQSREHRYISALVADDFGGMRELTLGTANSFARKKLDAASQALQLRSEQQEKKVWRAEVREHASAERGIQADLRESDRRISLFWRRMMTKVRPEKEVRHTPPRARKRLWPYASIALPKYDAPVIDRRGERGVFAKMRYYSRRTAEIGVSERVLLYCYNGAALDADGVPYARSNIGETIDETLCALDHLEQVNWSAQKNAKILMHGLFAVDHRQTPDEMMRVGTRWAEATLGAFDLPYLVTLHAPPEDGDARNWHLHILWSYRPMVRTGDHEWQVAEMLRTDLDNPAAMKIFREMYAAVMTDVAFEAGQNQIWTAKSNAARGLVHEPQVSLGSAQTNRARQGEYVPANEENHERVMRSKAAVLDEELRHADEALAREQASQRAIARRWARLPALPSPVPQRTIAAGLSASLPQVAQPLARSPVVVTTLLDLPVSVMASRVAGPIASLSRTALPRIADADRPVRFAGLAPVPNRPARPALPEIANLRFSPLPRSGRPTVSISLLPHLRPTASGAVTLPALVLAASAVPRAGTIFPAIGTPPLPAVPSRVGPFRAVTSPPPTVDLASLDRTIARLGDARRRDDERRERERADAENASGAVAERAVDERRRQAMKRLFAAIAEERHFLAKENDIPIVAPRLLAQFGLTAADVTGTDARKRIAIIAKRQTVEVSTLAAHVAFSPYHIVRDGEAWVLNEAAPSDLRRLAAAWRNDATIQRALGRVVATRSVEQPTRERRHPLPEATGAGWARARGFRDQTMAESDAAERLDDTGLTQPGSRIARPGTEPAAEPQPLARRFAGLPGTGIG